MGLSSGEQHKCKVCRNGGSCKYETANMSGCREEMGNYRKTAGRAFWWLVGLKYAQLALVYNVFCSLGANKCFIPQQKCIKTVRFDIPAPSSGTCQVELLLLPRRLGGGMQGRGGRGAAGQGRRWGGGRGGGGGRGIAAGVRLVRHRDVILRGDGSCA